MADAGKEAYPIAGHRYEKGANVRNQAKLPPWRPLATTRITSPAARAEHNSVINTDIRAWSNGNTYERRKRS